MNKWKVIIPIFLIIMLMPIMVNAKTTINEEDYYAIKIYEKERYYDFSSEENLAIELLMSLNALESEYDEPNGYFYYEEKNIFNIEYTTDGYDFILTVADDLEPGYNVVYTFSDDDILHMGQNYTSFLGYSGIKLELTKPTCNSVCIESIKLDSKSEKAEIMDAKESELLIDFDIIFHELNDYAKYKIVINNTTDEDYIIDENKSQSEFVKYEYEYDDNSGIVEKNSKKTLFLTIKYDKEVPDNQYTKGKYGANLNMIVNLSDGKEIVNPSTIDKLPLFIINIAISSVILYVAIKQKKKLNKLMIVLMVGLILIPFNTYAINKYRIDIDSNIEIFKKVAEFDKGQIVNDKMYNLASGEPVENFKRSDTLPNEIRVLVEENNSIDNIFSSPESLYTIYGWYDETDKSIYYYCESEEVYLNVDSSYMFEEMGKVKKVPGLETVITSRTRNMNHMFYFGLGSSFDADLSNWDTSNVTNMSYMFTSGNPEFVGPINNYFNAGNIGQWDTSKVTDMSYMFCLVGLENTTFNLDLSNWDVSSVRNMFHMFEGMGAFSETLTFGNLKNWNTSKVENMGYMFAGSGHDSTKWSVGDISKWDTSSVRDMNNMFSGAGMNSTEWSIGNLDNWNTSNVRSMNSMFSYAGNRASSWSIGDLSRWDTSKVRDLSGMFAGTGGEDTTYNIGNLKNWNTSNAFYMNEMFYYAGSNATDWSIGDLSNWDTSKVKEMHGMFNNAGSNATTFNIGNLDRWNISNVTNTDSMFLGAGSNATTWYIGDLSNWDTSKVTYMHSMFSSTGKNATDWSIGNLSRWDTSKVTTMESMFYEAGYNATTFDIGNLDNWKVSNVTNMRNMFENSGYNSTTWNIGDLSRWDTSKVTDMLGMLEKAGRNATTWNSIGSLNVHANIIRGIMYDCPNAKVTINIYSNPGNYAYAFGSAATVEGSGIVVNYSENTTRIDNIIATKSDTSNVTKGSLLQLP